MFIVFPPSHSSKVKFFLFCTIVKLFSWGWQTVLLSDGEQGEHCGDRAGGVEGEGNENRCQSLRILLFNNPWKRNLCFSNSITSALLNIPMFKMILANTNEQMTLYRSQNEIMDELIYLNTLSNLSKASTLKLRSLVH